MPDPQLGTPQTGAKNLERTSNPNTSVQGLDLAEYTSDGQPLPLIIIPSHRRVYEQDKTDQCAHPLHGVGIIDYYPESNTGPLPKTFQNSFNSPYPLPAPRRLPPPIPGLVLPPSSVERSTKNDSHSVHAKLQKFQSDVVAKILEEDTPQHTSLGNDSFKKRHWDQVSNGSRYVNSRDDEDFKKMQDKCGAGTSTEPQNTAVEEKSTTTSCEPEQTVTKVQVDTDLNNAAKSSKKKNKKKGKKKNKGGKKKKGKK